MYKSENTWRVQELSKFYMTFNNLGVEVVVERIWNTYDFSIEYIKQPWFEFNMPDELLTKKLDEEQAQMLLDQFFIRMNMHPDWYDFDFEVMN